MGVGNAATAGLASLFTIVRSVGRERWRSRAQARPAGPVANAAVHNLAHGLVQGQRAGRCSTRRRCGRASRAGTFTRCRRSVPPRASVRRSLATAPAPRSRLCAVAAQAAQALLAEFLPKGRRGICPSIRSVCLRSRSCECRTFGSPRSTRSQQLRVLAIPCTPTLAGTLDVC
jgi:hypothetical protein